MEYKEKKKNRHRDRKKSTFVYGKGIRKKKAEKIIKQKDQIQGIYSQIAGKNFWFIDVEWVDDGFFVIEMNKNWAFDWDEVIAELKTYRGKEEAVILHVVKRGIRNVVWELKLSSKSGTTWDSFGFVIPRENAFESDVFIAGSKMMWAKHWDIVWVNILDYSGKNPSWEITEILWKKGDIWINVDSYILEAWFHQKFDETLLESLEKKYSKETISQKEITRRKDFRKTFTFTIDGEDAKDLDDAISIQKKENGSYKLIVHIADVAHYVTEDSKLNKEAFKRGTSVYLTDRVIPMLPEILSNNLCSLNIGSDKLSLSCEILISESGELVKSTVYESIIRSDFRLTYKEVDQVVQTTSWDLSIEDGIVEWTELFCGKTATSELIEALTLAEELRSKITQKKNETWVLNFDFPETKVILDDKKEVVEIKEYPRFDSNKMIEEFMVMANEAVSRKFATYPFLYRIHEKPEAENQEKLTILLNLFNIDYKFKEFDTREVWELLTLINSTDNAQPLLSKEGRKNNLSEGQKKFLEKSILRTLSKAVYSDENEGHFGLGLQFYSHFTSPIRRYPDLQIHRIIKEKLQWELSKTRIIHYKNLLKSVAGNTSDQERKAEKLEYKVRDYYICGYYKKQVSQQFVWDITTILPYWCFVQLPDSSEWFVELIPKWGKPTWWVYNEQFMKFENKSTGQILNLWDSVDVILNEVDMELLRMNFTLA